MTGCTDVGVLDLLIRQTLAFAIRLKMGVLDIYDLFSIDNRVFFFFLFFFLLLLVTILYLITR